jgi:acyl carrier protein
MSVSDNEEKVFAALRKLMGSDIKMTADSLLREDLGLDSAALIELTVLVHTMYGVDLGRRAAERKVTSVTVGDVARLLDRS